MSPLTALSVLNYNLPNEGFGGGGRGQRDKSGPGGIQCLLLPHLLSLPLRPGRIGDTNRPEDLEKGEEHWH